MHKKMEGMIEKRNKKINGVEKIEINKDNDLRS